MSRDINDLEPETRALCLAFLEAAKTKGYNVIITATYRSFAEQDALYAQGRTKPGQRVTNARGGQSNHNYRVAFDMCPLDAAGKADWNNAAAFKALGAIGESVGLSWGGRWKSFPDMPHFEKKGFVRPS